jgi:hypothetical protein
VPRREGLTAVGSMLLAFLASQHHTLHMLLFTLGMGSAGMGFMNQFPVLRRAMLLMSLMMTGWTVYRLWRRQRPTGMRIFGALSAALSLALIGWSVYQFGL